MILFKDEVVYYFLHAGSHGSLKFNSLHFNYIIERIVNIDYLFSFTNAIIQ